MHGSSNVNPSSSSVPLDDLIKAWAAWDKYPGSEAPARALVVAVRAYVGDRSNDFYRHVASRRREGRTFAAAIYSWEPE